MPTYVYKCSDCGHRFEHAQGFHDDPLDVCPDCGGSVRRVIGNVAVTFKGSGFYRTDSRTGTGSVPAKGASSGSAGAPGESGSKDSGTAGSSAPGPKTAPKSNGSSTTAPKSTGSSTKD